MKVHLHRYVSSDLIKDLKELEKKYRFEEILKTGIFILKNKEAINFENIEYLKNLIKKTNNFINKFEYLLTNLSDIISNAKDLSWIFSKSINEIKEKIDEITRDRYYFILKKYKSLLRSYREDISGLITILSNYLKEDQLRYYVKKFNRKIKEYEI